MQPRDDTDPENDAAHDPGRMKAFLLRLMREVRALGGDVRRWAAEPPQTDSWFDKAARLLNRAIAASVRSPQRALRFTGRQFAGTRKPPGVPPIHRVAEWCAATSARSRDIFGRMLGDASRTGLHAIDHSAEPIYRWLCTKPRFGQAMNAIPLARSCIAVAAANLLQRRLRLAAAVSGTAVALFMLLLQISILDAARSKVTALYDDFRFDLAIVPDTYQFLPLSFDTVDRISLDIARGTGDVSDTFGLNVHQVHWTQLPSKQITSNFVIGLDDPGSFLLDRDIRAGWDSLRSPHAILADKYSQYSIGPVTTGTDAEIGSERVTVVGQFKLGLFFYADGATVVQNNNFARFSGRDTRQVSIGLIQLKPGIPVAKAIADIGKALPDHTLVLSRDQLLRDERTYFLTTRPIGVMIYISMIIACVVGAAIIVQVLSTEVSNRMNEYAVLKAMGANQIFVYGIGMAQAALLGLGGLLPATLVGALVLALIEYRTHLSTSLSISLAAMMLVIALTLAAGAGAAVIRRVQQADPAELF